MDEDIQRYENKITFLDEMSNNFVSRLNSREKSISHSGFEEEVLNLKEKIRKEVLRTRKSIDILVPELWETVKLKI